MTIYFSIQVLKSMITGPFGLVGGVFLALSIDKMTGDMSGYIEALLKGNHDDKEDLKKLILETVNEPNPDFSIANFKDFMNYVESEAIKNKGCQRCKLNAILLKKLHKMEKANVVI